MVLTVFLLPDLAPDGLVQLADELLRRTDPAGTAAGDGSPRPGDHAFEPRPLLAISSLREDACLLGRFQRAASAVDLPALGAKGVALARRSGGGRAIFAAGDTLVVHLALPSPSALLPKAIRADLVLNRYVRGLAAGLGAAGATAGVFYFGRDYITSAGGQLGVVSQTALGPRSSVLFEAVIGIERALELPAGTRRYPDHSDPRAGGPPWTCLGNLWDRPRSLAETGEAIASAYARMHDCRLEWSDAGRDGILGVAGSPSWPPLEEEEEGLAWSGLAEIPIGFLEALVGKEADRITEARLRGDFIAPAFFIQEVQEALRGCPADFLEIGRRIDAAFQRPGAVVHGVRSLRVLAEVVLEAART